MKKEKEPTLKHLGLFILITLFGVAGFSYAANQSLERRKSENNEIAQKCLEAVGEDESCEQIDLSLLKTYRAEEVKPYVQIWETNKAEAQRRRQEEAAEARAKFEAESWWEEESGIFIRWCDPDSSCPGRASNHYTSSVWRAMVWCKERACGDIYARLNILRDGVVVGWTNDTAYGGYGQEVVLTFGSSTRGSGRIVEFSARG